MFEAVPDLMGVFFVLFGVLFVGAVIFIIVVSVRNWRVAKQAGYDPLAMETQLAAQVGRSALLAPAGATAASSQAKSIEERLIELDGLHARGVISDGELAAARAKALEG